jgi:hypothetical protein
MDVDGVEQANDGLDSDPFVPVLRLGGVGTGSGGLEPDRTL